MRQLLNMQSRSKINNNNLKKKRRNRKNKATVPEILEIEFSRDASAQNNNIFTAVYDELSVNAFCFLIFNYFREREFNSIKYIVLVNKYFSQCFQNINFFKQISEDKIIEHHSLYFNSDLDLTNLEFNDNLIYFIFYLIKNNYSKFLFRLQHLFYVVAATLPRSVLSCLCCAEIT